MTTHSIRLVADASAVEPLIEELSGLAEELPDLRVEFGKLCVERAQIVQIDADLVPTVAALEYRLFLKPTDFLLALVTAARARDVQGVAQVIAAHESSVSCGVEGGTPILSTCEGSPIQGGQPC
jgi:hypothetical protein